MRANPRRCRPSETRELRTEIRLIFEAPTSPKIDRQFILIGSIKFFDENVIKYISFIFLNIINIILHMVGYY